MLSALACLLFLGCCEHTVTASNFDQMNSFLSAYCSDCHNADERKGGFRLDELPTSIEGIDASMKWGRVIARIDLGEMPPAGNPAPPVEERQSLSRWTKEQMAAATLRHRLATGRTRSRRLNRTEYQNTVCDLLGIETDLQSLLPEDNKADGFDTAESALSISPVHIQRYLVGAEAAIDAASVHLPQPELFKQRFTFAPETEMLEHANNKPILRMENGVLQFFNETHPGVPAILRQFDKVTRVSPGRYRVRVSFSAFNNEVPRIPFAIRMNHPAPNLVGYYDALPGEPQVIEFIQYFHYDETIGIYPYRLTYTREDLGYGRYQYEKTGTGPGLCVQWIEVEGPLVDEWPPKPHQQLYGDLPFKKRDELPGGTYLPAKWSAAGWIHVGGKVVTVDFPAEPLVHARQLLASFLPKAFRRPVDSMEVEPYLQLVADRLTQKYCFQEAMAVAYRAILTAPDFLFLKTGDPGPLDNHALASRLSYFIWRSMPDDELRQLADRGELVQTQILREQTERLLRSPKSKAFIEDFVGQWLGLHQIDATTPDKILYPEFFEKTSGDDTAVDGLLRESIIAETRLFIADMIENNRSVKSLIESDFTYLNDRLALHYGISGVDGLTMRKVSLPPDSGRGGVLTQASVLKVTANGTTTSPVLRGKWVLENILNRPPSPPPPDAGSIEPDIRGAKTIREQLVLHQRTETCAGCHLYIDPPGFALEAYDPIGLARKVYRTTQTGDLVDAKYNGGEKVQYHHGATVEVGSALADGRSFATTGEYKQLLLSRPESIAQCVASKLITFATGSSPEAGDRLQVEAIAQATADQDFGLRAIIHEVVQSELFKLK